MQNQAATSTPPSGPTDPAHATYSAVARPPCLLDAEVLIDAMRQCVNIVPPPKGMHLHLDQRVFEALYSNHECAGRSVFGSLSHQTRNLKYALSYLKPCFTDVSDQTPLFFLDASSYAQSVFIILTPKYCIFRSLKENPEIFRFADIRCFHEKNPSGLQVELVTGHRHTLHIVTVCSANFFARFFTLPSVLGFGELIRSIAEFVTRPSAAEFQERLWELQGSWMERGMQEDSLAPGDSISQIGVDARGSEIAANSNQSSILSVVSAAPNGNEGRCFLASALFIALDGQFIEARNLNPGSWLRASNCQPIQVKLISLEPPNATELVELVAGAGAGIVGQAILKVTSSHRVVVKRGDQAQTIPAGSLREGDQVFSSDQMLETLVRVQRTTEEIEIANITFAPDLPVAAFALPRAILSKGHGLPKTTRRSLHRRHAPDDEVSIPDTEDSFR